MAESGSRPGRGEDHVEGIIHHHYNAGETRELVNDYLKYKLTQKGYEWTCPGHGPLRAPSDVSDACGAEQEKSPTRTMQRLADEFETRYSRSFDDMCRQLHVSQLSARPTFIGVTNELFDEGIQWGRIVALFVFAGSLATQCVHKEMPQLVDSIAEWVIEYVDQHLAEWIANHGGWEGFVEHYDVETHSEGRFSDAQWPTLRNFFCGVAAGALGVLTIGAILTSRS